MAEMLRIDYGEMKDAADKLSREWENMTDSIQIVSGVVKSLPDFWEAETANRYMAQYEELEPGIQETIKLISDMAEQMNKISANFQDTDSGMAGQM